MKGVRKYELYDAAPKATSRIGRVSRAVAYWFVLLGLVGEFSTNPAMPGHQVIVLDVMILGWIAFGISRLIKKRRATA